MITITNHELKHLVRTCEDNFDDGADPVGYAVSQLSQGMLDQFPLLADIKKEYNQIEALEDFSLSDCNSASQWAYEILQALRDTPVSFTQNDSNNGVIEDAQGNILSAVEIFG